ncbi:Uu.00g010990.m01.CDS01 [Anthostomella pinea]|uniref:Uu.00g010990.m01.CDS01 n=1 Tax=Anthostomella pinea TaxID=933095 RepID=A0AAI8YQ46_9PEZI|nr:Uu.00g010990.m01.CDS01 [Anthostomella pinea]
MPTVPHVDDRNGVIVMTAVFTLLIILAVAFRFYARHLTRAGYGADDWLAAAALFFTLALNGIFLGATIEGAITGHSPVRDGWPVTTPLQIVAQKYKYAFQITEKVVFGLVKLSLLFLWKRLFGSSKPFRIVCRVMIPITVAWTLAFLFTTIFQCGTRWTMNWAPIGIFLTQCIESLNVLTVFSVTDILSDLIIIAMPVPVIWRLHQPTRKKIALTSIFLVGFFTIGAGIARTYMYLVTSYDKEDNPDFIADFTLCILWSEIEANVAMLVCCMPTLAPVIGKFGGRILSSIHTTGSGKGFRLSSGHKRSKATDDGLELPALSNSRRKQSSRLSSDTQLLWQEGHGTVTAAGYANAHGQPSNTPGIMARTDISTTYEVKGSESV